MAGSEFLDKQGLMVLWDRIKELVYECCCGHKDYECINDEVITTECFEKAVLSVTGGKGGDCGFSCDTRISTLYEGTIAVNQGGSGGGGEQATRSGVTPPTPISTFYYGEIPYGGEPVDTMRVTINGEVYICEATTDGYMTAYADSISKPTFVVACISDKMNAWGLLSPTTGTYNLKLENYYDKVETTECFDKAVQSVIGYSCSNSVQSFFDETVETLNESPAFSNYFDLDTLTSAPPRLWVDFDNKESSYVVVDAVDHGDGEYLYGASYDEDMGTYDFSVYPFAIWIEVRLSPTYERSIFMLLATEMDGNYHLGLAAEMPTATVNDCFKAAVNKAVDVSPSLGYIPVYYDYDNDSYYSDMSFADMNKMFQNGTLYAIKLGSASGLGANYSVFPLVSGTSYIPTKASTQNSLLTFQHTEVYPSESGVVTEEFVIDLDEETITNNLYKYPHTIGDEE